MKDQQTTVLAVTHNQEEIDQASRLITIKGGKWRNRNDKQFGNQ